MFALHLKMIGKHTREISQVQAGRSKKQHHSFEYSPVNLTEALKPPKMVFGTLLLFYQDRFNINTNRGSPSAPWQMSVLVAPPTMNWGSPVSSCGEMKRLGEDDQTSLRIQSSHHIVRSTLKATHLSNHRYSCIYASTSCCLMKHSKQMSDRGVVRACHAMPTAALLTEAPVPTCPILSEFADMK